MTGKCTLASFASLALVSGEVANQYMYSSLSLEGEGAERVATQGIECKEQDGRTNPLSQRRIEERK